MNYAFWIIFVILIIVAIIEIVRTEQFSTKELLFYALVFILGAVLFGVPR